MTQIRCGGERAQKKATDGKAGAEWGGGGECFVTEMVRLSKCSAWHFVKGAEEQFLSSPLVCQREGRRMTARGLVSVKHDGSE